MLTVRERFKRVMNFKQADRLPILEWAPWWDKTIERWLKEVVCPRFLVQVL